MELFRENEVEIQNDFVDYFLNRENRISFLDCVLSINPHPGDVRFYAPSEINRNDLKKWLGILEGTMIVYIANGLEWVGMWKDIKNTFHFRRILTEEEKLLLDERFSLIINSVNEKIYKAEKELDEKNKG